MAIYRESEAGVSFAVKVTPRARRDEIVGVVGEALQVKLNAPPVEGRANEALVRFLAKELGVKRGDVEIVRGETARRKMVRVRGVSRDKLKQVFGEK